MSELRGVFLSSPDMDWDLSSTLGLELGNIASLHKFLDKVLLTALTAPLLTMDRPASA